MDHDDAGGHHHHDDDGGEGQEEADNGASSSGVSCSICLDLVLDNGVRSRAKLQCGHEFHLDCIGSAFNMKGSMQCPNCRKVEKGQWLYATGSSRSLHEHSLDDWLLDEEFYDLSYNEMPYRVHWCPFGDLERVGSAFEEVESPSTTYHDLRVHPSLYAEHAATSSVAHSYVAYVGPVPPTSSRSNDNSEDPNFNHHWNGLPVRNEIFNPHPFPAINIQYHNWARHSPPFSLTSSHINGADSASVPPLTLRSSGGEPDPRPRSLAFPHPVLFGHGSGPTAGSSFISSIVPHPSGISDQARERIQISHTFHPRQSNNSLGMLPPIVQGIRRFDGVRGLPALVPAPPQPDHTGGFFIVPPSSSSGQNPHEAENPLPNHFRAWERERSSHFQPVLFDLESGWGSFYQNTAGSDSGSRSRSFWHRPSS